MVSKKGHDPLKSARIELPLRPDIAAREAPAPAAEAGRVVVFESVEEAEPSWRRIEAGALATPYQSFEWIGAWSRHASPAIGERPIVIARFDADGAPVFLLPFGVVRRFGLTLARPLGGKHANYNLGIYRQSDAGLPSGAGVRDALLEAAERYGIDAFLVANQPRRWLGLENPLAELGGMPSPSNSFSAFLCASAEERSAGLSRGARRKLKQKERALSEIGPVVFARAETPHEIKRALDAHQAQKAAWFARNRRRNVFAEPGVDSFLRAAALSGLPEGRAGIEVHYLGVGDDIAAVFAGAARGGRFCGMILSADICRFGRSSPGELLMSRVIDGLIDRGITSIDLGVGEADYKRSICPNEEALFDLALPASLRGRAACAAWYGTRRAKAHAKKHPRLSRLLAMTGRWRGI